MGALKVRGLEGQHCDRLVLRAEEPPWSKEAQGHGKRGAFYGLPKSPSQIVGYKCMIARYGQDDFRLAHRHEVLRRARVVTSIWGMLQQLWRSLRRNPGAPQITMDNLPQVPPPKPSPSDSETPCGTAAEDREIAARRMLRYRHGTSAGLG